MHPQCSHFNNLYTIIVYHSITNFNVKFIMSFNQKYSICPYELTKKSFIYLPTYKRNNVKYVSNEFLLR